MSTFDITNISIKKLIVEALKIIFKIIMFVPKITIIGMCVVAAIIAYMFVALFSTCMGQVFGFRPRRRRYRIFHI